MPTRTPPPHPKSTHNPERGDGSEHLKPTEGAPCMNLNQYQEACRRTQNHELSQEERLTNATMGLNGEILEYIHDHINGKPEEALILELGDVLFYAAWIADLLGRGLEDLYEHGKRFNPGLDLEEAGTTPHERLLRFTRSAGIISEVVKKYRYHGNRTLEQVTQVVPEQIAALLVRLERLLPAGVTIQEAAIQNHQKLLERYPDGFQPLTQ